MSYIAHIREKDKKVQTVQEHLHAVKVLSEKYGEKIGVKHITGLAGLLHDLGKNTEKFKQYILAAVNNPDDPPPKGSVDHSTAGGKLIYQLFFEDKPLSIKNIAVEWIAMCIISHHGGLRDFLDPDLQSGFLKRMLKDDVPEYEHAVHTFYTDQISESELREYFDLAVEEVLNVLKKRKEAGLKFISLSLILKFIFSSLIDADRTNSRMFEEQETEEGKHNSLSFFNKSYALLMKRLMTFDRDINAHHPINRLRSEMSLQCEKFALRPSGIYTLSIPTGGGKTLASLRYALKHAITYKKDRIVFIVPYTTIIEQNADVVKKILGDDENILEHHSNIIHEPPVSNDENYDLKMKKVKLIKDNWDSPIIFTTMVQFLNVFYSKGTRNVRRLHNLANSVIVFDEVQSVPVKTISLFNEALNFLSVFGNSSIVLSTATQPALNFVEKDLKISTDGEIVKGLKDISRSFKRVEIIDKTTPQGMSTSELQQFTLNEMGKVNNALVILNTRAAVRKLYEKLKENEEQEGYAAYHLSTYMCPAHRKEILKKIKLAIEEKKRVICVSTQLIEAGVDISFECVIRSLAGLDSIAQAAGRCNRHGEDAVRNVYIIKSSDEVLTNLKTIAIGAEKTKRILDEYSKNPSLLGGDLLSPEALTMYFKYYFDHIKNELNYPIKELGNVDMYDLLDQNNYYSSAYRNAKNTNFPLLNRQSFATAEEYFRVIDNPTKTILVPFNEKAKEIIAKLNGAVGSLELSQLLKQSQHYSINVYDQEYQQLGKKYYIHQLLNGNIVALAEIAYSKDVGLDLKGEGEMAFANV